MTEKIGITTTVPAEIIYAAGDVPVDLNNVFITGSDTHSAIERAEMDGYPRNLCGWIKGIYGTVLAAQDIKKVVAVTQGDCSNTHALMETLELAGIKIIPFAFPYDRDRDLLKLQMEKLMECFNIGWEQVVRIKDELDRVRRLVWEIDRLTWEENLVSGWENHYYQVCCSDFNGNPEEFARETRKFIEKAQQRKPFSSGIRLGFIGVPPILTDIYQYLEKAGARVVFNEVQRQFSMPFPQADIVEQYRMYTYPYHVFHRVEDISREVERRKIDAVIHYTQSFCFRQIEDIIFRTKLKVPFLSLEGDQPGQLDARSKMRIDSFLEMLR
ncbi:MAG: 2-hydroxyacyl-CoA dehydratase family protein [Desulfitobacteriaceae bacterium]|nr:2-hydroxyacyl-CoA dehydratase family protein [Desulfitobacteriaceae bacterium]MDD4752776.1 2-hydroxyacyl-CoA dehydratase family protein [Desulfitobacteriaceae bacterium]